MEITARDQLPEGEPLDASHFTAPASAHLLHRVSDHPVAVSVIRFPAGSRNHWHRHSGGQVLAVLEGEALVAVRGQPPRRLRPGDVATTPPGEEHWHGAAPEGPMAHLAITAGETTWLEPPAE